jgi:hypothetical protein
MVSRTGAGNVQKMSLSIVDILQICIWLTSARLTQEQEERDNKEARERFAESQRKKQGGSKTE